MVTYRLTEFDVDETSDDDLRPVLDAANLLEREQDPRASDMTLDELRIFTALPGMEQRAFVAWTDSGDVAAIGDWRHPTDGSSADVLNCAVRVLPEHRRHGIGTMMLRHLANAADQMARGKLQGWIFDTVPSGAAFVAAIGATTGDFAFQRNVVRIADLDRSLMDSWSRIGEERAAGYSIRLFEGLLPDEVLDDVAYLHMVLDRDMPRADDMEPREWTAQRYDEMQRHYARESEALTAIAYHDDSGRAVGLSQLARRKADPATWLVTVTMVDREHRGHSLGKWVKGVVNIAALERWEDGVHQETNNAFTNEAMLAINREMGFKHEYSMSYVTMTVDDARAYLDRRAQGSGRR